MASFNRISRATMGTNSISACASEVFDETHSRDGNPFTFCIACDIVKSPIKTS
jgi:hypothetical protein